MSKTIPAIPALIAATLAFLFGTALGWRYAERYYAEQYAPAMSRPAPQVERLEVVEEIEAERVE